MHTAGIRSGSRMVTMTWEGIEAAIAKAKEVKDKPSVIKLTTTIGFGSKLQGTGSVHGSALKADDIKQLKEKFGFDRKDFCRSSGGV
jgi:transketolase